MAAHLGHAAFVLEMLRRATEEDPQAPGDKASQTNFFMGVLFAFLGSTLQALGLGVMKLQYNVNDKEEKDRLDMVKRLTHRGIDDAPHRGAHYVSRSQSSEGVNGEKKCSEEASPAEVKPEIVIDAAATNFGNENGENGHGNGVVPANGEAAGNGVAPAGGEGAGGAEHQGVELAKFEHRNLSQFTSQSDSFTPVTGDRHTCNKIPWIWITGFVIFIVGNIGDFYALGVANQSVVPLVGSWALVVTLGVARFLLKEEINWWDVAACVFIVLGIVLTVVFGTRESSEWELPQLLDRYEAASVQALLAILFAIIVISLSLMHADYLRRRAIANKKQQVIKHVGHFIGTLYCLTGATIASFTVLFGKAFSGLLFPLILEGDNKFSSAWAAIIVVAFLISLPSQMYLIHASLMVNDMSFHIPTFYVLWNVGSILTSAVYYREMDNFGLRNYLGFLGGALVLFIGCYFTNIAARHKHLNDDSVLRYLEDPAAPKPDGLVTIQEEGDATDGAGVMSSHSIRPIHDGGRPSADIGLSSEDPMQIPSVVPGIPRDPAAFGSNMQGGGAGMGSGFHGGGTESPPWMPHRLESHSDLNPPGTQDWTPFQPPVHQLAPPLNTPLHPLRLHPGVFVGDGGQIFTPPLQNNMPVYQHGAPPQPSWGGGGGSTPLSSSPLSLLLLGSPSPLPLALCSKPMAPSRAQASASTTTL